MLSRLLLEPHPTVTMRLINTSSRVQDRSITTIGLDRGMIEISMWSDW